MTREYIGSDGSLVNETGQFSGFLSTGTILIETSESVVAGEVFNSSLVSISSIVASLSTNITLASSLFSQSSITATLVGNEIASSLSGTSTVTAVLATGINLATTVSSIATLTAALTTTPSVGFYTPVIKNNTGTVLANEVGVVVNVYNFSTGALVVRKTGLTSDASGIVHVSDASLVASTVYAYEVVLNSNGRRLPTATAS